MEDIEKSIVSVFSKRVQELRDEKGWSQDKLGELAGGISRVWISNIETKDAPQVSLDVAYRIAKAFGMTLDQMLGEKIDINTIEIDEDQAWELMKRTRERKRVKSA